MIKITACPECQKVISFSLIGNEKFEIEKHNKQKNTIEVDLKKYKIFTVWYCYDCNIIVLREPEKVFG